MYYFPNLLDCGSFFILRAFINILEQSLGNNDLGVCWAAKLHRIPNGFLIQIPPKYYANIFAGILSHLKMHCFILRFL